MDEYTIRHLSEWISNTIIPDNQERVAAEILAFVAADNYDLLADHSWSEIMRMADINY